MSGSGLRVAVLGLGTMGAAMARRIVGAGIATTVWNRSAPRAEALAGSGVVIAPDAATAVAEADLILTMLFDADATRAVAAEAFGNARSGAVWMQSATIGVEAAREFAALAAGRGLRFVDAPVLGTKGPAEAGKLTPLVAGSDDAVAVAEPVLAAIGERWVRTGEAAPAGSALKVAVNTWIAALTAGIAQSLTLAERLGLDPRLVLEALAGTASDSPYAHIKGEAMLARDFAPQFEAGGLLKDLRLARAATSEMNLTLLSALEELFAAASDPPGQDIAAVWSSFQTPAS
ncbi:NAD(P)-dependent oxidoreductase [Propionicicella superfundia]|uniref:NAD(P)-dependent oxidoreductase n=1 Tax=Propionicicella superfundia TaxID=348582 RepID=UPI00041EED19|nr:NAD(P)-dependent oxidoreductase [Propionicicella superfundia]